MSSKQPKALIRIAVIFVGAVAFIANLVAILVFLTGRTSLQTLVLVPIPATVSSSPSLTPTSRSLTPTSSPSEPNTGEAEPLWQCLIQALRGQPSFYCFSLVRLSFILVTSRSQFAAGRRNGA